VSQIENSVRPALVEGQYFFSAVQRQGQGFDKLDPNGMGAIVS
jgi:hypothetical protein